jgi:YjbE family integral membrane protein
MLEFASTPGMPMNFTDPAFWISVGQIILIDILLGGDNAVVIALACRRLPPAMRRKGILWGVVGAVAARIVLIFFALQLLELPYLKAIGAVLLLWIGVKLMLPDEGDSHGTIDGGTTLWSAVRTVIVADVVMSLDNVIAVSAAANGHLGLVVFGILVSVPIIVWGSSLVLRLIDRFPLVITLGAALLGWIAGSMLLGDIAWKGWADTQPAWLPRAASVAGSLLVVVLGTLLARRSRARHAGGEAAAPSGASAETAAAVRSGAQRVLVPVDLGSPVESIARHLRHERTDHPQLEVELLNVQIPVDSGHARMFVSADDRANYCADESRRALEPVQAALDAAGVPYRSRQEIGHVVPTILRRAHEFGADRIIMGRHGRSDLADRVLGSIASAVSNQSDVPVTLVR